MIILYIILIILVSVESSTRPSDQQLLMEMRHLSADSEKKSGPIWAWPISPSWLYLLLPLIMSTIYLKLKYDLHRYAAKQQHETVPVSNHIEQKQAAAAQHPGLALTTMQEICRRIRDPEMEAIAHWLGRELSIEEWGRVPLSRMTPRQLQALGFMPGCPILSSPQYKGMSATEIGDLIGITDRMIDDHAASQKIRVVETLQWSDMSRFEEIN